jgi:hypothetical protein
VNANGAAPVKALIERVMSFGLEKELHIAMARAHHAWDARKDL